MIFELGIFYILISSKTQTLKYKESQYSTGSSNERAEGLGAGTLCLVWGSSSAPLAVREQDLPRCTCHQSSNPGSSGKGCKSLPAESLWYVSPTSFLWSLHSSIKASGVLRSGSGPHKIHVASPLTRIQHLAKKKTRATAARTPWSECSSFAGPSLPAQSIVFWSRPLFTLRRAHSQWAEMKLCIQVPEPIFTFVSKNHMQISIYKQQQKTPSMPSHMYKPLPPKERSQLFHLCIPVKMWDSPSLFLLLLTLHYFFHRLYHQGPCDDTAAQSSNDLWTVCIVYPKLHLTPKDLHLLPGMCALTFSSTEKWIAYRNFSHFFPIFTLVFLLFVPHRTIRWHLEQDSKWC